MTDLLLTLAMEDEFSDDPTCRNQDQPWIKSTINTELEIEQLLTILVELLQHLTYRRLQQRAIDYFNALSQLKNRFQRLRLNVTCGMSCLGLSKDPCFNPSINEYTTRVIDAQLSKLTESLDRTKTGCYQFLSRLVTLNLF
ncbi:hypothetical protein [Spirosoma validum]|uniref:Uncharacterized protein n=1 Tax=Spirosoma validum TaxID=2771355 RepID=A0A927B3Q2_9BACT|nr:hypothetical protein [Spirosoma validum]MBD2755061.1 hypothetical protein [Spirosoma validum]